ncbi:hypothetical protein BZA05DRAFT_432701 [Tricharina praecox]|uniref:uncharacterized protein n=1 Tax=Tricharina praecox TaxID=43433 RepID=UPI00221FC954|nr:uncharacterized protein BZA05DRAFT_432701 [Tricharina praecox]KAI5858861.1 hypothetical protein BZA05DRAFT_432701 [Tricharina praecox]
MTVSHYLHNVKLMDSTISCPNSRLRSLAGRWDRTVLVTLRCRGSLHDRASTAVAIAEKKKETASLLVETMKAGDTSEGSWKDSFFKPQRRPPAGNGGLYQAAIGQKASLGNHWNPSIFEWSLVNLFSLAFAAEPAAKRKVDRLPTYRAQVQRYPSQRNQQSTVSGKARADAVETRHVDRTDTLNPLPSKKAYPVLAIPVDSRHHISVYSRQEFGTQ